MALADSGRIRAKTDFPNFEIVTDPKEATGAYVLFLDPDLEPLEKNWLTAMAEQLSNPRVGAVGARIISPDKTIESAGLILSPDGTVGSAFAGYARDFRGANRQLQGVRNYSAVSGSCLLTRKDLVDRLLLDSALGSLNFVRDDRVCMAVEFCLALREQGLRTVSSPTRSCGALRQSKLPAWRVRICRSAGRKCFDATLVTIQILLADEPISR